ncbi:hypothetical protein M408DRAFT_330169 [Serendipita vermifera MAFF 305830]|uniref:Uncharacterized protein n=1 Tax=Serendipita vermifera MAFF 305830 TaxID=933852 RepID=A0A0C3B729_SERVB|nr:hypothetical protein M408DRAFT_330169 [Serendipita vermifera MAFF 305830]
MATRAGPLLNLPEVKILKQDRHLLRFLSGKITAELLQEFLFVIKNVINVPQGDLNAPLLPTPPIAPIERFNPVGHQAQAVLPPPQPGSNLTPLSRDFFDLTTLVLNFTLQPI